MKLIPWLKQDAKLLSKTVDKEEADHALAVDNKSMVCSTNLQIDSKILSKFLKSAHSILAKKAMK